MKLSDFYNLVKSECELNGFVGSITAHAMQNSYNKDQQSFSCSTFVNGKSISSGLHANPQAAIESFRLEIKQYLILLNAPQQDIEL